MTHLRINFHTSKIESRCNFYHWNYWIICFVRAIIFESSIITEGVAFDKHPLSKKAVLHINRAKTLFIIINILNF
jgi:hypothetical protein